MSQVRTGLAHFSRLSPSVWIHQPTISTISKEPDLILIVGWMNASPRHIAKYTAGYEKLYPSSRILAITTTSVDAVFRTNVANLNRIKPVLDILCTLPPGAKFLLHLFSNGGAFTSTLIANAYQGRMGRALPVTATVMDSTPGKATYEATVRAFAVALPKSIPAQVIGGLLLRMFFGLFIFGYWFKRKPNLVDQARLALNKKELFDTDAPRMYIYSVADDMVAWRDVEEHGRDAEGLGYRVDREKFLESGHAAHLTKDEGRYWDAVQRLWERV
jgi:hypothetical protein